MKIPWIVRHLIFMFRYTWPFGPAMLIRAECLEVKMIIRNDSRFATALFLMSFAVSSMSTAQSDAATLSLDYENSFFFGQRGAGVKIAGVEGTSDFGHPFLYSNFPYEVYMYGSGHASQTVTTQGVTYEVGENLQHRISIDIDDIYSDFATINLYASLNFTGLLPDPLPVTLSDNDFGDHDSYADAWGYTYFRIDGVEGEMARVHINAEVSSALNHPDFDNASVGLGGCYPNNFSIWHNGENIWDAGTSIDNPNGSLLDDFVFDAMTGDTFIVNSAVWATLGGKRTDDDFQGNYAHTNFEATVELESMGAVPVPGAIWLFGSGLLSLSAIRRRFQKMN